MLLSEHVYCVAVTFKMTEWVEQWICTKFCICLNTPLRKLFRWFRRLQLQATGDWQLHHNNMPAHASHLLQFFGETSNHPGDSAPLQPRFGALRLLAFPKTKITFERKEISDCRRNSGKYNRAADGNLNYVRSQSTWGVIVLCTMFLVSYIFFSKCLYFSYYMAGYLLDRPLMCVYIY